MSEYENPPLNEVVMGVAFDQLPELSLSHMGIFWSKIKERFPKVDHQPPINIPKEAFGKNLKRNQLKFSLSNNPEARFWYINENGSELIQLQTDCFIRNWRQMKDTPYPRYETLIEEFKNDFQEFERFVATEKLGTIKPVQCELSYLNQIQTNGVWTDHSQLEKILHCIEKPVLSAKTLDLENTQLRLQFTVKGDNNEPYGRLYVNVDPVFKNGQEPLYLLKLLLRGYPATNNLEGVLNFFDKAHNVIVDSFTDLTTDPMHKTWERKK